MVAGSMSVSKFLKIIIITEKAKHGIRFYPITVRKLGFLAYAGRKKKHVKVYFEIKYLLYFFRVSQEAKRGFTFFFFHTAEQRRIELLLCDHFVSSAPCLPQ